MSSKFGKKKNAGNDNHNRTNSRAGLSNTPEHHVICQPRRINQMKWIAVLDKLRISPTRRHQSLRRTQKRMHSPNHPTASADDHQSYENVSRHKQPNAKVQPPPSSVTPKCNPDNQTS
jgi:hypothetical protein